MNRAAAAAGSWLLFALAPGVVAGVVPWSVTGWDAEPVWQPMHVLGALVTAAAAAVLVHAFWRFVSEGIGTPAPVAPTRHLVVGGLYRYVRNPMYIAVVSARSSARRGLFGSRRCSSTQRAMLADLRRFREGLRGADAHGAVRGGVRRVSALGAGMVAASTTARVPPARS